MGDAASTLYYTFSTIAQSLAAAIALLGAFVLFRMQSLGAEIERRSDALLELGFDTGVRTKAADARARGDVRSLLEITSVQITAPNERVDYARRRLKALYAHETALLRAFWVSLGFTVALIAASILALSRVPELCEAGWDGIVLDASLWGIVACLASYAWLLGAALRSTSHHER